MESIESTERRRATLPDARIWPGRFRDRVALVTGASDRGIGGAIARRLAAEGAAVSLLSRHRPQRLMRRLEELGEEALWTACDVRRQEDINRVIDLSLDRFGNLDIVINNAAVEWASPIEQVSEQRWQELLDVNLSGVVRVIQTVLPHMEMRRTGVIVNVASVAGLAGVAGLSAYSATKAGLVGLTRSLALELACRQIRVVAVAPAVVKTPMTGHHAAAMAADNWEKLLACHPLGIGTPRDVAAAVAFLASDEARWISGVTLPLGWATSFPLPFDIPSDGGG